MFNKALVVTVAVSALFFAQALAPSNVEACICGESSPKEAMRHSSAVFIGKTLDVQQEKRSDKTGGSSIVHTTRFEVITIWKGVFTPQIETVFMSDYIDPRGVVRINDCDFSREFVVGETYIIYAIEIEGRLDASLHGCGRTALLSDAEDDLRALGKGRNLTELVGMPKAGEPSPSLYLVIAIMVTVLGLGVGLVLRDDIMALVREGRDSSLRSE